MEDNTSLITYFLQQLELNKRVEEIVIDSRALYLGMASSIEEGFELVVEGEFNRNSLGFGLFLSFDWKKVKSESGNYWIHRDGIKLSLDHYGKLIISTGNIEPLIDRVNGYNILDPQESIYIGIKELDPLKLKELTNGFIKTGIDEVDITLDRSEEEYQMLCRIWTLTESKAKAFSRLLNLFFRLMSKTSTNEDLLEIVQNMDIQTEDNTVIMNNITLNEKIIIDFINNVIFIEGEADK